MAKPYKYASSLAKEIDDRRKKRSLSFEKLGVLSDVDTAQTFRICRGDFRTLNPSVLKICNALDVVPDLGEANKSPSHPNELEKMLSAEVLAAWDKTDAGEMFLKRVLRALHRND